MPLQATCLRLVHEKDSGYNHSSDITCLLLLIVNTCVNRIFNCTSLRYAVLLSLRYVTYVLVLTCNNSLTTTVFYNSQRSCLRVDELRVVTTWCHSNRRRRIRYSLRYRVDSTRIAPSRQDSLVGLELMRSTAQGNEVLFIVGMPS